MVDERAVSGYRDPKHYRRARPDYPDAAVATLMRALDLRPGAAVVELGAGTGIFTRRLRAHGLHVTPVEPVAGMRSNLPDSVNGTAEDTSLPAASTDAVVAATAWHWFDAPRAIQEVARLLRPGGGLGLIWNSYDESVPWVAELASIADSRRPSSQPSERSGRWREFFTDLPGWAPLQVERIANPWPTTAQGIIDRVLSSSVIAALPPAGQDTVRAEVRDLITRHGLDGDLALPYVTAVYWTTLK